jgi:DNA-binding Lrp family transcriptional regulator
MDATDRLILRELQINARRPNRALADAAGVSPSTMLHRVRSLEARNVIRGYHADVDLAALGRRVEALVFVRLQPKSPAAVEEFMDSIWSLDETVAVTLLTGTFDVLVHLSVQDIAHLSEAVLTAIASAPNVMDEQTSIIFEHRRKQVLEPVGD